MPPATGPSGGDQPHGGSTAPPHNPALTPPGAPGPSAQTGAPTGTGQNPNFQGPNTQPGGTSTNPGATASGSPGTSPGSSGWAGAGWGAVKVAAWIVVFAIIAAVLSIWFTGPTVALIMLIIGVLMLLGFGTYSAYQRSQAGQSVGAAALGGLLDVTGLQAISEGYFGWDLARWQKSQATAFERGEMRVTGPAALIGTILLGLGIGRSIRSYRAGTPLFETRTGQKGGPNVAVAPSGRLSSLPDGPLLQDFKPGSSGFSGVYDTASGQWMMKPSGTNETPPQLAGGQPATDFVQQIGGHQAVQQILIDKAGVRGDKTVGFAVINNADGTLTVRWNSGINTRNFGDRPVPAQFRGPIIQAIQGATGKTVRSE